jgi:hypothetical protein
MQSIGIWGLREEARKSWYHFVSDEIVYLAEAIDREFEGISLSEQYLNGECWLEVHLTRPCNEQRNSHFQIICEAVVAHEPMQKIIGVSEANVVGRNRASAVLVEIPEFVQLPKGIISKRCSSQVRLKRVNDVCHCGWKQTTPVVIGGTPLLEDREINLSLLSSAERPLGREMGQSPSKLIERRSETANEIPEQHRDYFRRRGNCDCYDVHSAFKIGFFADGVGFRGPLRQFPFERLEVFVRPTGLHLYEDKSISKRNHKSCFAESGTISA